MNNSAVSCIEVGLYGRAIASLMRALALSRRQPVPRECTCTCRHCLLDACIVRSGLVGRRTIAAAATRVAATTTVAATTSATTATIAAAAATTTPATSTTEDSDGSDNDTTDDDDGDDNDEDNGDDNDDNDGDNNNYDDSDDNDDTDNDTDTDTNTNTNDNEDDDDNEQIVSGGSYIIRNPIRVECRGHVMGPALYLIITFNLALTNHLMALCATATTTERAKRATNALELYRLTYRMQATILHREDPGAAAAGTGDDDKDGAPPSSPPAFAAAVRSIRFEMMVLNNTSQVHKTLTRDPLQHRWCLRRLLSTMMIVVDHRVRVATAEGAVPIDPAWQIDMDGFFRNTIYLILGDSYTSGVA